MGSLWSCLVLWMDKTLTFKGEGYGTQRCYIR